MFLYELPTGKVIQRLTDPKFLDDGLYNRRGIAHLDQVQSMDFASDGELLVTGGYRTVKLWRREKNLPKKELPIDGKTTVALAGAPDGKTLATANKDGVIHLWSLESEAPVKTLQGHASAVSGLTFAPKHAYPMFGQ